MSKPPLSTFDYLINKTDKSDKPLSQAMQVPSPQNFPSPAADDPMADAVAGLATPILKRVNAAPEGKERMFRLVEALEISVDNLRPVLDLMAGRHNWISLDKSDLKGDWAVTLTPRGREYVERYVR
jgi:hypothetical protein